MVIIAEKLRKWKAGLEEKGLSMNMSKTKFMFSGVGLDKLIDAGKDPCAVCRKGVGSNSIYCGLCEHWVHGRCSGVTGRLKADPNFVCPRCAGLARPIDGRSVTEVVVDGKKLEVVDEFCYLGDMAASTPSSTDAESPGLVSESCYLSSPPERSLSMSVVEFLMPVCVQPCSMAAKPGVQPKWNFCALGVLIGP